MRRLLPALLGLLLLVAGCGVGRDAAGGGPGQDFQFVAPGGQVRITYDPPESRQPITDLRGESLLREGTQVGIGDFPDTVRVINIWGSWCGPCRTEAPELQAVAEAARGKAVVLGIDVRDDREKILYFEGEPRFEMKFLRRAVADDENLHVVALQRTADSKFLRLDIDDPRWVKAMQAIRDAMRVIGSKVYVRCHRRDTFDAPWQPITTGLAKA
mgnify:CR=1 FL=1